MAKPEIDLKNYESGLARFDSLMQNKIKDILLVSSLYDSFILEEDGHLAQMIFNEYVELNLSYAPQIKQVSSGEDALKQLELNSYDLVIVFRSLGDLDIVKFGKKAKEINTKIPIVLLAFHGRELSVMDTRGYGAAVNETFLWSGETNILLAIVKYIEDLWNVDFDTRLVGVRVIVLVEDSVRFYSAYLPILYTEIMQQTQALMSDGLNLHHKLLRMRTRPKILLAQSLEEALVLVQKHKKYLLGVITDIRFSNKGKLDKKAGFKLAAKVREIVPDIPILLQSSNLENEATAHNGGFAFLHKKSPVLLKQLSRFIRQNFGFGNFIFRMPDGEEVGRAEDYQSMEEALKVIPVEAILYHANRNHFSNWLMARTEFDLADKLRPRKASEFDDPEDLRNYLITLFKNFRHDVQLGIVADFSRKRFDLQAEFVRIGSGSLGGKGRGLAFINRLLRRYNVYDCFDGVRISVPPSAVIGASVFDRFLEDNNLRDFALNAHHDYEIANAFVKAKLPRDIVDDLSKFLDVVRFPIAVRSSSLLEDSHYQPFAGIYDTHMLPNNHPSPSVRLERLEQAVKYIYASIFFNKSKNYIEATGNRVEEEKMAVVLQKVAGSRHGERFYPTISGVARSYNFYSIGNIKPEEGVVYAALGLGITIVDGRNCLYFSPANPQVLPQFSMTADYLKNSQNEFYAIDMSDPNVHPVPGGQAGLITERIDIADSDGTLKFVGSTYMPENDRIYSGTTRDGIKIITFAPILKSNIFPLAEIIQFLLKLGSSGMNFPVEIEFAAELSEDKSKPHQFRFLQIRPMAVEQALEKIDLDNIENDQVVFKSEQSLSHGHIDNIRDIIYVDPDSFDRAHTPQIALEVGGLNKMLTAQGRPYLLLGPGRWGTADRWLGVPTSWDQISGARVIIEAAYGDFNVQPSFGTHFFQNIIAFQIGYLTINKLDANNHLDWEWLKKQKIFDQTKYIKHIRLEEPLDVLINGRDGKAAVMKPVAE